MIRYIGIIPARYASTRFPGKPLALLGNKPVIQHVYEQARKALQTVVVATDDERIADCVRGFGGEVVMTRADHTCGTDRCLEAYVKVEKLKEEKLNSVIINIQGDEPFVQPEQIEALKACFTEQDGQVKGDIATLVIPFKPEDGIAAVENPNHVKVAIAGTKALLFSRSIIPYVRGAEKDDWLKQHTFYKHLGMYAYRADVLASITQLPQSELEKTERLEQLRWLENGYDIQVGITETQTIGIDTPEDLEIAKQYLETRK